MIHVYNNGYNIILYHVTIYSDTQVVKKGKKNQEQYITVPVSVNAMYNITVFIIIIYNLVNAF